MSGPEDRRGHVGRPMLPTDDRQVGLPMAEDLSVLESSSKVPDHAACRKRKASRAAGVARLWLAPPRRKMTGQLLCRSFERVGVVGDRLAEEALPRALMPHVPEQFVAETSLTPVLRSPRNSSACRSLVCDLRWPSAMCWAVTCQYPAAIGTFGSVRMYGSPADQGLLRFLIVVIMSHKACIGPLRTSRLLTDWTTV